MTRGPTCSLIILRRHAEPGVIPTSELRGSLSPLAGASRSDSGVWSSPFPLYVSSKVASLSRLLALSFYLSLSLSLALSLSLSLSLSLPRSLSPPPPSSLSTFRVGSHHSKPEPTPRNRCRRRRSSIYHEYSIGPSIQSIFTRCCFTMTNMIQVYSNFHWAQYSSGRDFPLTATSNLTPQTVGPSVQSTFLKSQPRTRNRHHAGPCEHQSKAKFWKFWQ